MMRLALATPRPVARAVGAWGCTATTRRHADRGRAPGEPGAASWARLGEEIVEVPAAASADLCLYVRLDPSPCTVLYCTVLYCTVLYCTVLLYKT